MSYGQVDHGRVPQFYQGSSRPSSIYGRASDRRDFGPENSPAASQFHDAASYRRAFAESIIKNSPHVSNLRAPSFSIVNIHQDMKDFGEGYRRFEQFWGEETAKMMLSGKPLGNFRAKPKKRRQTWRQRIHKRAKAFFKRITCRRVYRH
ncbi:hypothetical protein NEOLI_002119 [Neolecta irregularis DAH-3]|uniref:Uncharacterized protein n=1 Tax=Neolecta irregularis (strain DAH-3) TaxID=1198029 RepID=A0A1U7LU64_NEOID|nr:hypothetical protein NEOLI_002119 [Neolecta irregularis DAH-3]|eukprot:OLL26158.1 hypothetical protein NEOLI_002119 [Neolecta irregularis DAH-3]